MAPEVVPQVQKAYGPDHPQYAGYLTGGIRFTAGRQEPPIRVFIGRRSQPAADGPVVISPPGRPSWWSRLFRKRRL